MRGKACNYVGDNLPIPDDLRDDFKVACKVVTGGAWGALFHTTSIGPEPDRSHQTQNNKNEPKSETQKSEKKEPAKKSQSSSTFMDRDRKSSPASKRRESERNDQKAARDEKVFESMNRKK